MMACWHYQQRQTAGVRGVNTETVASPCSQERKHQYLGNVTWIFLALFKFGVLSRKNVHNFELPFQSKKTQKGAFKSTVQPVFIGFDTIGFKFSLRHFLGFHSFFNNCNFLYTYHLISWWLLSCCGQLPRNGRWFITFILFIQFPISK